MSKHSLIRTLVAFALVALVAMPVAADAAKKPKRPAKPALPQLFADPDPKVPGPEAPGEADERKHSPHVYFTMRRGIPGAKYRIILLREPRWNPARDAKPGVHCKLSTIISNWERTNARGAAAWPLQPVSYYTSLFSTELCPGDYLGKLEQKYRGTRAVLHLWFEYPSMKILGKPVRR